jgi:hypothetical protein
MGEPKLSLYYVYLVIQCHELSIRIDVFSTGMIYDPYLKFNLLGILKLAHFFNDKDYIAGDDVDSNGTTIKSSGCRSCLTWDHGQHISNFTCGDSTLP